jgi:hypothetical protein
MIAIETLFAALLTLVSPIAGRMRACVERRHDAIVRSIAAAETTYGVPPALTLVVGFLESHWGCHPRSGGSWGAPISPTRRLVAGTAQHTAVALASSFRACQTRARVAAGLPPTWTRAMSRFRCGLCVCPDAPNRGYSPGFAINLARRVYVRAGVEIPVDLR